MIRVNVSNEEALAFFQYKDIEGSKDDVAINLGFQDEPN